MPQGLSLEIKGLDQLSKKFGQANPVFKKEMGSALIKSTLILQRTAKQEVPVQTGRLQKSISVFKKGIYSGGINANVKYARAVHDGTGPYIIQTKSAKVLSDGVNIFGKKVRHPGIKANPFFNRTLNQEQDKITKTFLEAAEKLTKYLAK